MGSDFISPPLFFVLYCFRNLTTIFETLLETNILFQEEGEDMEKHHPDCQLHNLILHDLQPTVDEEGEALLISFGKGQTAKRRETGHLTRGKRFLLSVKKPKYSLFEKLQKTEIRRNAAYNVLDKSFDGSNPENQHFVLGTAC